MLLGDITLESKIYLLHNTLAFPTTQTNKQVVELTNTEHFYLILYKEHQLQRSKI
jgi:hypothetical protein